MISHETVTLVSQQPQVQRGSGGQPIASGELVVVAALPKRSTGLDANVEVRGVGEQAWDVRPGLRIIDGRRFTPGLRELIVGKRAREQFSGVDVGSALRLNGQLWHVVGEFLANDANDSDLWGDVGVVGPTYRRGNSATSVTVKLTELRRLRGVQGGAGHRPAAQGRCHDDARVLHSAVGQPDEADPALGNAIGVIMAIGAVFGALNSMYAAVATRTREIATLRALGFRGAPVVVSVMLETMLLALLGRNAGRGDRLAAVRPLHGIHARIEFHADRVCLSGVARIAVARIEMGAGHGSAGGLVPSLARRAPVGDRRVARALSAPYPAACSASGERHRSRLDRRRFRSAASRPQATAYMNSTKEPIAPSSPRIFGLVDSITMNSSGACAPVP